MSGKHLRFGHGFQIVAGNERSQAAQLTLEPGEREGGPENRHRGADQWLFTVSGEGVAIVEHRRTILKAGTIVLIERGAAHEIRNIGKRPLKTLNVYVPPAYGANGDEKSASKP